MFKPFYDIIKLTLCAAISTEKGSFNYGFILQLFALFFHVFLSLVRRSERVNRRSEALRERKHSFNPDRPAVRANSSVGFTASHSQPIGTFIQRYEVPYDSLYIYTHIVYLFL